MVNALVFFAAFGVGSVAGASLGLWWIRRSHLRDLRRRVRAASVPPNFLDDLSKATSGAMAEAYEDSPRRFGSFAVAHNSEEPIGKVRSIEQLPSGSIIVTAGLLARGPEQSNKIKSETESK